MTIESDEAAEVVLSPIQVADAGEVLTVQRAAFVSEALIYGSADMPPLVQTLEELEAELRDADGWVARIGPRIVGAIRTRESDGVLLIGRIAIAPTFRDRAWAGCCLPRPRSTRRRGQRSCSREA